MDSSQAGLRNEELGNVEGRFCGFANLVKVVFYYVVSIYLHSCIFEHFCWYMGMQTYTSMMSVRIAIGEHEINQHNMKIP